MSELEESVSRESAFHPDNVGPISLIVLLRIYDLLAVIAAGTDKGGADAVEALHQAGGLLYDAPPFLAPPADYDYSDVKSYESDEPLKTFVTKVTDE